MEIKNLAQLKRVIQEKREFIIRVLFGKLNAAFSVRLKRVFQST